MDWIGINTEVGLKMIKDISKNQITRKPNKITVIICQDKIVLPSNNKCFRKLPEIWCNKSQVLLDKWIKNNITTVTEVTAFWNLKPYDKV
jgi:hypothetical protein